MLTTIIITVCSTLCAVALIASIAVAYYRLSKKINTTIFHRELDSVYRSMDDIRSTLIQEKDYLNDYIHVIEKRLRDIIQNDADNQYSINQELRKKIDSRADRIEAKLEKLRDAVANSGIDLKVIEQL
jgi:biopolymer transport protein ExbB/TolQ